MDTEMSTLCGFIQKVCRDIEEPAYGGRGRPQALWHDVVFVTLYLAYYDVTTRDSAAVIRGLYRDGFIGSCVHYTTISNHTSNTGLTPLYHAGIAHTSRSLDADTVHDTMYMRTRTGATLRVQARVGTTTSMISNVVITESHGEPHTKPTTTAFTELLASKLRVRTQTSQHNEVLVRVLCHNLRVLVRTYAPSHETSEIEMVQGHRDRKAQRDAVLAMFWALPEWDRLEVAAEISERLTT